MKHAVFAFRLLILPLLADVNARAQEGLVFALPTEGTASVYFSEDNKTAFVIDGGRGKAVARPIWNESPLVDALLDRGVKRVVFSCSHPHTDHDGGLKFLVAKEPKLTRFQRIDFVDHEYPESTSLYELFRKAHPEFRRTEGKIVTHRGAKGRNAFAALKLPDDAQVTVTNFAYIPDKSAGPHGHSIIHKIELTKGDQRLRIVDLDDADSALVARWALAANLYLEKWKPDILIAPHHCSDRTDISPLLSEDLRPRQVICTVNVENRFFHPGPLNYFKWVQAVGKENVLITGVHGTVRLNVEGASGSFTPESAKVALQQVMDRVVSAGEFKLPARCECFLVQISSSSLPTKDNKAVALRMLYDTLGLKLPNDCDDVLNGF